MNLRQQAILNHLSAFRRELLDCERRGRATRWLFEEAGALASGLRSADLPDYIEEADRLYERAMKLRLME